MRTNIDIDDELMAATMRASGKATKKAAVEEAMRHYTRAMLMRDIIESTSGIGWSAPAFDEDSPPPFDPTA
jgi:Arc/MetJ family transcription regulator